MPIDSHLSYLEKHAFCPPQIAEPPHPGLRLVVVVPIASGATMNVLTSLLFSKLPEGALEVIVVAHGSEAESLLWKSEYDQVCGWVELLIATKEKTCAEHGYAPRPLHLIKMPDLPAKHAGSGLARKIGMDEAVHRLRQVGNEDGLIATLDGHGMGCAELLDGLEAFMQRNKHIDSVAIPVQYSVDSEDDPVWAEAIKWAHLESDIRVIGLRKAGHPYAFPLDEVGMAVRLRSYEAQAGMNRRTSGDIFAFLQKFIEIGRHGTCWELEYPEIGRVSDRVNATYNLLEKRSVWGKSKPVTYAVRSYRELATGIIHIGRFFGAYEEEFVLHWIQLPEVFRQFLDLNDGKKALKECLKYSRSQEAFMGRFFRWMDSLRTLRFLEYCAEHHWPKVSVDAAAQEMREWITGDSSKLDLDRFYAWARAEVRKT
ncbi:MAG: hypothetical protein U0176_22790 [Bacteroidia bacterium]